MPSHTGTVKAKSRSFEIGENRHGLRARHHKDLFLRHCFLSSCDRRMEIHLLNGGLLEKLSNSPSEFRSASEYFPFGHTTDSSVRLQPLITLAGDLAIGVFV